MSQLNPQQAQALKLIVDATVDAVKAAGDLGAPGGVLYAALMAQGCSLSQFESLMGALVKLGKVRRSGELYFAA
jgi:hypothetical protein